jgi:phosphohistidine phosphatase
VEQKENEVLINDNLYEASARIWLQEVCNLNDQYQTVAMFGHNPGISYFAEYICKESLDEIPTCTIVGIKFENITSWSEVSAGLGKIIFFETPKK